MIPQALQPRRPPRVALDWSHLIAQQLGDLIEEGLALAGVGGKRRQLAEFGKEGSAHKLKSRLHRLGEERLEERDEGPQHEGQVQDHGRAGERRVELLVLLRGRGEGLGGEFQGC